MNPPTVDQIWNEELGEPVFRETEDGWRHGNDVVEVYHRNEDGTFWMFCYRQSTDGEYNGLHDGDFSVSQVWPKEKTVIVYEPYADYEDDGTTAEDYDG